MARVLPPFPYRVSPVFARRQRIVLLVLLLFVALFLGAAAYSLVEARGMAAERRIWATGVETTQVDWKGTRLTSKGSTSYNLDVRFLDADRVERSGRVVFSTWYGSIDTTTPPVVHYLAQHPDSFAFSKAMDLMEERTNSAAITQALFAGLMLFFGWLGLRLWRETRATRACALGSEEVALTVVSREQAGKATSYKLRGETPWGTPLNWRAGTHKRLGSPLFLDPGQTKVLALVSRDYPAVPVVIREGLLPYDFSAQEVTAIRTRSGG